MPSRPAQITLFKVRFVVRLWCLPTPSFSSMVFFWGGLQKPEKIPHRITVIRVPIPLTYHHHQHTKCILPCPGKRVLSLLYKLWFITNTRNKATINSPTIFIKEGWVCVFPHDKKGAPRLLPQHPLHFSLEPRVFPSDRCFGVRVKGYWHFYYA